MGLLSPELPRAAEARIARSGGATDTTVVDERSDAGAEIAVRALSGQPMARTKGHWNEDDDSGPPVYWQGARDGDEYARPRETFGGCTRRLLGGSRRRLLLRAAALINALARRMTVIGPPGTRASPRT